MSVQHHSVSVLHHSMSVQHHSVSVQLYLPAVRRELEVLQRTIQERNGEARQLQKQLADLERDRHTEVVKLRLEVYV